MLDDHRKIGRRTAAIPVLFAPGGSTAIGIALKLARTATGRHETVTLSGLH